MRLQLPVLLAAWLGEVGRIVVRAHDDLLQQSLLEQIGDVEGEGRVAALVLAARGAVDPDRGAVVDGAEMQQDAGPVRWSHERELAPVPARLVEPGSPTPLAGVSGAKGTVIVRSQSTSRGPRAIASWSSAKSHSPLSGIQDSRTSWGRGYPRPRVEISSRSEM